MNLGKKQPVFPGSDPSMGAYSPGISLGDLVFVSGQGPIDFATKTIRRGTIEEETELTLGNVRRVLEAAGCTLDDCVKVTVHLASIADFDRFNAMYMKHFGKPYPARTTVQSVLANISIEIDAIAVRGASGKK
jgi:2-iminobutanoate/2-iminopropanoate deaminase